MGMHIGAGVVGIAGMVERVGKRGGVVKGGVGVVESRGRGKGKGAARQAQTGTRTLSHRHRHCRTATAVSSLSLVSPVSPVCPVSLHFLRSPYSAHSAPLSTRSGPHRSTTHSTTRTPGAKSTSYWDRIADPNSNSAPALPVSSYSFYLPSNTAKLSQPPTSARMLTRHFIHDALYNPNYGYFSKRALIFSPSQPFDFNAIKDGNEFQHILAKHYKEIEAKLRRDTTTGDSVADNNVVPNQIWHTPTELFKPHYAHSFARFLHTAHVSTRLTSSCPLLIYELGPGNGTFAAGVLEWLEREDPEVYKVTRYTGVEISEGMIGR
ncbi:hypothetical protein HDU93_003608, partial [Gonapodya sp. JEL0774]